MPTEPARRRFARLAWATLAFTVVVILWGAYVRASGAGAGCGDHWPLCDGQVLPRLDSAERIIELTHRLTSGLLGLMVAGLALLAFRTFPRGHAARRWAAATGVLTIVEALLGAGLVLFEQVAYNVSIGRAYWMAAHLVNTLLLLYALVRTVHAAENGRTPRWRSSVAGRWAAALLAALVVVGMSGAVAALGDTLVFGGGHDPETNPVVATLVGLRIYHPILAVAGAALGLFVAWRIRTTLPRTTAAALAQTLGALLLVQLAVGVTNVALLAPVWMQIVHLLVTDAIWIVAVLLAVETTAER